MKKLVIHAAIFWILLCPIAVRSELADHSTLGFSFKGCAEAKPCESLFNAYLEKTFPEGYSEEELQKKLKSENYSPGEWIEKKDNGDITQSSTLRLLSEHENIKIDWTVSPEGTLTEIRGYIFRLRGQIKGNVSAPTTAYLPPIIQKIMNDLKKFPRLSGNSSEIKKRLNTYLTENYPAGSDASILRQALGNQGFLKSIMSAGKTEFEEWQFLTNLNGLPYEEWIKTKSELGCAEWWEIKWKNENGKISSLAGGFRIACT